tara:strand:- start:113 stop:484 length:372 start_codon:yes stop_codon:yes gene_type:complete
MGKVDFQIDYRKISFGSSLRYTSVMINIDDIFQTDNITIYLPIDANGTIFPIPTGESILEGYGSYRNARMTADVIFDARIAYQINKKSKFSILMNNVLNREYTNRPGNVMPPRTILWQYSLTF